MENKWEQYWRMVVILKTGIKWMREIRRASMHIRKKGVTLQIERKNVSPELQYMARSGANSCFLLA